MLSKSSNHAVWDWNMSNHTEAINFYREVFNNNKNSSLTLCY